MARATGGRVAFRKALVTIASAGLFAALPARVANAAPGPTVELRGEGDSHAGHVTVEWQAQSRNDVPLVYEVEESTTPQFHDPSLQYRGSHTSSVVSGLPNGTRYFRARARPGSGGDFGPWSETFEFRTEHHSLALAGSLFATGAVAFALTAAFVIGASRRAHRDSDGEASQ